MALDRLQPDRARDDQDYRPDPERVGGLVQRDHPHGRPGDRYLLGGENLAIRDVFALVATAAGRSPPRVAIPSQVAHVRNR